MQHHNMLLTAVRLCCSLCAAVAAVAITRSWLSGSSTTRTVRRKQHANKAAHRTAREPSEDAALPWTQRTARVPSEDAAWSWLGPPSDLSVAGERQALVASQYSRVSYFRAMQSSPQLNVSFTEWHMRKPRTLLTVAFIGDSHAREMAASCHFYQPRSSFNCSWIPRWKLCGDPVTGSKLTFTASCRVQLLALMRGAQADVIWLLDGLWHLRHGALGLPSQNPASARARYFSTLLDVAREFKHNYSQGRPRGVVVGTAFPIDADVFFSSPPKDDWTRFAPVHLSSMWADLDEDLGNRATGGLGTGVVIAPMHRIARRYPGLRCDGVHVHSWLSSDIHGQASGKDAPVPFKELIEGEQKGKVSKSFDALPAEMSLKTATPNFQDDICHPKLCLYTALMAAATNAAIARRTIAQEIQLADRVQRTVSLPLTSCDRVH